MASSAWSRYIHTTKSLYQRHHDRLVRCLERELGDRVRIFGADAGLHLLVEDVDGRSQDELMRLALEKDVRVYPTDQYWASSSHPMDSMVLMGFSGIAAESIGEGVRRLARAWG